METSEYYVVAFEIEKVGRRFIAAGEFPANGATWKFKNVAVLDGLATGAGVKKYQNREEAKQAAIILGVCAETETGVIQVERKPGCDSISAFLVIHKPKEITDSQPDCSCSEEHKAYVIKWSHSLGCDLDKWFKTVCTCHATHGADGPHLPGCAAAYYEHKRGI